MPLTAIVVHGGSGTIVDLLQQPKIKKMYTDALQQALDMGFSTLQEDATAMEAATTL